MSLSAMDGQDSWRRYILGEAFRDHVENDIMKREPHPEARPMGAFDIGKQPG